MIQVLYIAQLRELFNSEREQLALTAEISTLGDLRRLLSGRGAHWTTLSEYRKTPAAVNQQLADDDVVLRAGDEVAFFRPVTGG